MEKAGLATGLFLCSLAMEKERLSVRALDDWR